MSSPPDDSPTPTLYVSDLDGTLLGPGAVLSSFSRMHLERMLANGLQFTAASARSAVSMRGVLGALPLRLPVICFNGGFVSDLATARHHHVFSLGLEVAREAMSMGRRRGLTPIVSTTDGVSEDRVYIARSVNAGMQMYVDERVLAKDPRLRIVDDPGQGLAGRVTCLTWIDRRELLEPLAEEITALGDAVQPHLFDDMYTLGWSWITVHAGEASKARATRLVMEQHGMAGHRLVAFGDQDNDLPLLRSADYAIATANAVPAVRDVADEVIGHHGDDAVVKWLLAHG